MAIAILTFALGWGTLPAEATPADNAQLTAQLNQYLGTLDADYSVTVHELGDGGVDVGIDEHRRVEPASVVKLFYAWATLRRVDLGSLTLSSTMRNGLTWDRCLKLMITISDNDCSADIRTALGNTTLNTLFANSGYPDTRIKLSSTGKYKGKTSSSADTALLLTRLEEGTLLSPASTAYFHDLLEGQVWRTRINKGVPAGVHVENKGGELWVTSGWTQSDAAIVRGPQSTYVMTVYGRSDAEKSHIAQMSRIVYEFVQGETVTTPAAWSSYQYQAPATVKVRDKPGGTIIYRIPAGRFVKLFYSERNWVAVRQRHKTIGWTTFPSIRLRDSYRWE